MSGPSASREDAVGVAELRSQWAQVAIVEVFDHNLGKVIKVWVKKRSSGR